jgi:hypothetical protein
MTHLRGWGLLLAICVPLLVLFSWNRLGSETSRVNLERFDVWSAEHSSRLLLPLQQHYAKYKRPAGPGDVQLPPIPKESGVKAWSIQPDTILRVELNAKDDGRPVVLRYVPIVRTAANVHYDCVSATSLARVGRFCRAYDLHSEADIPAQLAANEQTLQNLPATVNASGTPIPPGGGGNVLVVPADVASLESCGFQCVKPQACVTPRPLACGRLVREGNTAWLEITATDEAFKGSRFATLAEADRVCEQAAGPGARVLRANSVSGFFNKLAGSSEYWVHDEMRPASNCWSSASK